MLPTLNNRQSTPLRFLPSWCDKPFLDPSNHTSQVFRVRFHDSIKLYEFSWSEKYSSHTKTVIILCQPQSLQQYLSDRIIYKHTYSDKVRTTPGFT